MDTIDTIAPPKSPYLPYLIAPEHEEAVMEIFDRMPKSPMQLWREGFGLPPDFDNYLEGVEI